MSRFSHFRSRPARKGSRFSRVPAARTRLGWVASVAALAGTLLLGCGQSKVNGVVVQAGKELFQVNCAFCHGPEGAGDGAAGKVMKPKASNLTESAVQQRPDVELFEVIKKGIVRDGRQSMPGAKDLSDEQITNLVTYVRTLARK